MSFWRRRSKIKKQVDGFVAFCTRATVIKDHGAVRYNMDFVIKSYLSHFGKPLKSPFFDRINNNFVYLAHDDGWFCKLYCRDMSVFKEIIVNKIIDSLSTNKRRKIYPMDEETKNQLLELTGKGLVIDFSKIFRDNRSISLNFYVIGHFSDMDEMYNDLERHKHRASLKGYIEPSSKSWKICTW